MEERADYKTEVEEALEMLGTGYGDQPAAVIEPPRTVIERRAGKMQEVSRPAFVKFSTAFKGELTEISGDALKVWMFICLSINRKTGKANPALRTIAAGVKLAVNTVQKCLTELESLNLLVVDRESRHYNLYEAPEYVSANRSEPVSNGDTSQEVVSNSGGVVSNSAKLVSPSVIHNQINQINQKASFKPQTIEQAIYAGLPVTEELQAAENLRNVAPRAFEKALGFSTALPWWSNKEWTTFADWVCVEYRKSPTAFGEYNIWRNTKYVKGGISNNRLRGFVNEFYDSWDMFQMSREEKSEPENYDPRVGRML